MPFLLSSDPVWQGDPSLGQPPGLLQLLRAIPPELPAQRVADSGCLTVQRQPGAPRGRGAGGGRGRRCHSLPGIHVALLALVLLQPLLLASSFPPPAPPVEAARSAGKLGAGLVVTDQVTEYLQQLMSPTTAKSPVRLPSSKAPNCFLLLVRTSAKSLQRSRAMEGFSSQGGRNSCC